MRPIVIGLFVCIPLLANTQITDIFTDPRDGRSYQIELIDSTWWFAENLMYETVGSHCPNVSTKDCQEANFYPYTELEEVCPQGWEIPSLKAWQAYVRIRQEATGVDSLTGEFFEDEEHMAGYVALADYTLKLKMLSEDAPLKLKGIGWVQGKRRARIKNITIWARDPSAKSDKKYHLHISNNSYMGHSHKHHIIDKPRRVRKFAVRCVKAM